MPVLAMCFDRTALPSLQVLDVESLQIDQHLATFIDGLRASLSTGAAPDSSRSMDTSGTIIGAVSQPPSSLTLSAPMEALPGKQATAASPWGILPPQAPQHAGRLTVLLDVDGTLISSFTPRRAPRLPASVRTHVVGVGSKLNPQGVFVVERPGLRAFLEQLALFAEVRMVVVVCMYEEGGFQQHCQLAEATRVGQVRMLARCLTKWGVG